METAVLRPEVKSFIKAHENDHIPELVLKGSPFDHVSIQSIVQQIKGIKIAKSKFPGLYKKKDIIYPPKINLEQSSSEITAAYKAGFISRNETVIDLTGGMGIDTMAFYDNTENVTYCEINSETFKYAKHNFKVCRKNIKTFAGNGIEFLKNLQYKTDWIYLDPSRRTTNHQKVFKLEECEPDILKYFQILKSKASKLLLKFSPLLDIHYCIDTIPNVETLYVVAVKNDVKELLIVVNFEKETVNPEIKAVNLNTNQPALGLNYAQKNTEQTFAMPNQYLYEPNAAVMKTGFFGVICENYQVKALHANSHLFTSAEHIDFPGRKFKVLKVIQPKKNLISRYLKQKKANISVRNYPLKPEQIKKKYGLSDGGSLFVFFTTNLDEEKIVLICEKLIT